MKLHLPCALRGALLACFAVASSTPAMGGWSGDSFLITADDITASQSGSLDITTAENTPGGNGWFLRSYYDQDQAALDGATSITINALTLTRHDSGTSTLNIAGHWNGNADYAFTGLTINSIIAEDTFTADAPVTISIAGGNTLTLGDITGASATPLTSDNVKFTVDGTLNLAIDYLDGLKEQITEGSGTLALQGTIDLSSFTEAGSQTYLEGVSFGNIDTSKIQFTGLAEGLTGALNYSDNTLVINVTTGSPTTPDTPVDPPLGDGPVVRVPMPSPTADTLVSTGAMGIPTSCMKVTGLESFDDSGAVTINITGTLTNPGYTDASPYVLLLSSKDLGGENPGNMEDGNFCIYVTKDGELVVHSKEQTSKPGDADFAGYTSRVYSTTTCANWFAGEYDITIRYGDIGGVHGVTLVSGSLTLGANSSDTNERINVLANASVGSGVITGSRIDNVLETLYTRLPGGMNGLGSTFFPSAVVMQSATWLVQGQGFITQLFTKGVYDVESFDPVDDIINFKQGGELVSAFRYDGEGGSDTIANTITADDGAAVTFRLNENGQLGTRPTIVLEDGEGALNQKVDADGQFVGGGLTLVGQEDAFGGKLVLNNIDSSSLGELRKIVVGNGLALELNGRADLSINNADESLGNNIGTDASLIKGGGGSLSYTAKEGDKLHEVSNADGALALAGQMSANFVTAKALNLTQDGTAITGVNTVTVAGGLTMGSVYGSSQVSATLEAKTLQALDRIDMGAGTSITATTVETTGAYLAAGATISVGTGNISIISDPNSKWANAYVSGTIGSDSIDLTANGAAPAEIKDLLLSNDGMATNSITNGFITVSDAVTQSIIALADSSPKVLELGTAKNTVINGTTDTAILNTALDASNVTITGSDLQLSNGTVTNGSSISVTGGNLLASQVSVDSSSSITADSMVLNSVTLNPGTTLTAGTGSYEFSTLTPQPVQVSGSVTPDTFDVTRLVIDLSGTNAEGTYELLTAVTAGSTVNYLPNALQITTASGFVATPDMSYTDKLVVTIADKTDSLLAETVTSTTGLAALTSITDAVNAGAGGELEEIFNDLRNNNVPLAERQALLKELSSSSITMLADSQRLGVVNTVNNLRNRIIQMGNVQGHEPETHIHGWIQANGSYNDVDQDGSNAGYEYQTWGGTVGVHADVGNFSFGAAISAAYGDLTAHSDDNAEGDHDSVNLSFFARHQKGNWTQMGILSFGRNEVEMTRSVGDYDAEGDASGHTITAYYEAGYTIALDEECTQVLQPLVSVMLTSARMGGISETGTIGNAGLCSDTEDYFYGTLGIGARYQIVLAEDVNERLSFLELRAKLVQDFGDETNELGVHFAGAPGQGFTMKGADVGRTGFQFGAGISVPVATYTTLFADVDADIRSGATSVSGGGGMRVEF